MQSGTRFFMDFLFIGKFSDRTGRLYSLVRFHTHIKDSVPAVFRFTLFLFG